MPLQIAAAAARAGAVSPAPSTASSYEEIVYGRSASVETLDVVLYPLSAATTRAPRRSVPWADDRSDDWDPERELLDDRSLAASEVASEADTDGTEDYVVLARPRKHVQALVQARTRPEAGPSFTVDMLAPAFAGLRLREREQTVVPAQAPRVQSPTPPPSPGRRRRRPRHTIKTASDASTTKPGLVLIEDDTPDMPSTAVLAAAYEEAARYITHFLTSPAKAQSKSAQLAFLQALIIELGLYRPLDGPPTPPASPAAADARVPPLVSMPLTLTSARAALKARAFVSVVDYLSARAHGPDALAAVLHPSRSALRRALAGPEGREHRWAKARVKESGLGVLLVGVYR